MWLLGYRPHPAYCATFTSMRRPRDVNLRGNYPRRGLMRCKKNLRMDWFFWSFLPRAIPIDGSLQLFGDAKQDFFTSLDQIS